MVCCSQVVAPQLMTHLDGAEIRQVCTGEAHNLLLTDYYCADAVPERVDQGADASPVVLPLSGHVDAYRAHLIL